MLDKFAISTDQVAMIVADAREDAIVGERERIIKLLEANKKWCNADAYADMGCDCPWHLAIALIKGENK